MFVSSFSSTLKNSPYPINFVSIFSLEFFLPLNFNVENCPIRYRVRESSNLKQSYIAKYNILVGKLFIFCFISYILTIYNQINGYEIREVKKHNFLSPTHTKENYCFTGYVLLTTLVLKICINVCKYLFIVEADGLRSTCKVCLFELTINQERLNPNTSTSIVNGI